MAPFCQDGGSLLSQTTLGTPGVGPPRAMQGQGDPLPQRHRRKKLGKGGNFSFRLYFLGIFIFPFSPSHGACRGVVTRKA